MNICTVYVYIRETFGGYQVDTVKLGHFNYLIKFTYRLTLGFQVMEFHVTLYVLWPRHLGDFLSNIWQPDSLEAVGALCVLSVDPEMHC